MTSIRDALSRALAALPDSWERVARRQINAVRTVLGRWSRRDRRPIDLPGSGPVVLFDARGQDVVRAMADLDTSAFGSGRLILLTDDPRVHEYRSGPFAAVEFLPSASAGADPTDGDQTQRRVDELKRLYQVTDVIHAAVDGQTVVCPDA